jgi:two-component system C4-dicarboxylate transport sensor histidine kinase DctB
LEKSFAERTADLSEAVTRLQREVAERQRAEQTLRAAQDELVQAAKLAVLGQMATGITHELSQPLGALRTLSENAVEFMRRGDQGTVEKNLGIIGKLVDRMGAIIDPLKSFARKSPARPQSVDIGQAVANALFLLDQRLSRSRVAVANNCQPGEVSAWCDAIRLEQVLVNLVGNAIDAMADQEDKRLSLDMEAAPAGRVLIRVADNGSGLAAETMERIFEPFFTTKPAGDGLGLGLAISRDIVRDFGGELTVSNRTTGGAEFVIDLPAEPAKG